MKKIRLAILAILFPYVVWSATMFDPDLQWYTITTANFRIHYHNGIEPYAHWLANISEKVHSRLAPKIGWTPFFRTDVVLVDNTDFANGFATPFPYNRVQIFLSRPALDSVINNFDEWLEFVFIHEYTHILNLDTIWGIPSLTRYSFGRCCFPNIFLPFWQIEGNAVYHESYKTTFGRNNSTFTHMVLRCEIASNTFKSLSEMSHYPRRWPGGSVPYLYGGLFIESIERKYGYNSFAKVFHENADNIVPYFINYNLYGVYNKDSTELYMEWKNEVKQRFAEQIQQIKFQPLTKLTLLTSTGYYTILPRFHPNGSALYWIKRTAYDTPSLMGYSFSTKKTSTLCTVHNPQSIAVTNRNIVYCSDVEFYNSFSVYADIFEYDGTYRQKTTRLRAIYLDASPDGTIIYFVKQEKNRYSLIKRDIENKTDSIIIDKTDVQLSCPKISPDGTKIALTIKDSTSNTDLVLIDLKNKKFFRITDDRAFDIHPAWHPDGSKLVFSSDRTGVYNLYEANLFTNTLNKLTNLVGGAFHPDVSPDGAQIAFANYDTNGFNIAIMAYGVPQQVGKLNITELPQNFFLPKITEDATEKNARGSPYTITTSVLPSFWIPIFYSEELWEDKYDIAFGFQTYGMDTLMQIFYRVQATIHTFQKRASIDTDVMLASFYPNFLISYFDEQLFYGKDEFPWNEYHSFEIHRELERRISAGVHIPFYKYLSTFEMVVAYHYSDVQFDEFIVPNETASHIDRLARVNAALYYSNTRTYAYSISDEDGITAFVSADQYYSRIGSDYTFTKLRSEISSHLPGFSKNHVVFLRMRAAGCFKAPSHVAPYRLGRYEKGTAGEPLSDEESWGMRGYPAGLLFGTRLATATFEYRFPLLQYDFGYSVYPFMFRDLWIQLFGEIGDVWHAENENPQARTSAGIELHLKITAGYMLDVSGFFGYGKGFNKDGENQIYFGFAGVYEGALNKYTKWFDYL